jgi:hypothetical protein
MIQTSGPRSAFERLKNTLRLGQMKKNPHSRTMSKTTAQSLYQSWLQGFLQQQMAYPWDKLSLLRAGHMELAEDSVQPRDVSKMTIDEILAEVENSGRGKQHRYKSGRYGVDWESH